MCSLPYLPDRPVADPSYVLRTVQGCGLNAAHRLAVAERYEAAAVAKARARFLRESCTAPSRIDARIVALRSVVGATLIRLGERLRGQPVRCRAADPVCGA